MNSKSNTKEKGVVQKLILQEKTKVLEVDSMNLKTTPPTWLLQIKN